MKGWAFFLFITLLVSSISAQEQFDPGLTPDSIFWGIDKTFDNIRLGFASEGEKALVASSIREERLAEAREVVNEGGDEDDALAAMEDAELKLKIIQEELAPEIQKEVQDSSERSIEILTELKEKVPEQALPGIENAINRHIVHEEKLKISAEITAQIDKLCTQLIELVGLDQAVSDESRCNPDLESSPKWLKKKAVGDYKNFDNSAKRKFIEEMRSCMRDPRECRCEEIPVKTFSDKCTIIIPYMIKCQFEQDESSCMKLDEISRESQHMFEELPEDWKGEMMDMDNMMEGIERKDFEMHMPDECIEVGATTKEACMRIMMERHMPPECREAGAATPEACENIMQKQHSKMQIMQAPSECMHDGEFVGDEECEKIMESKRNKFRDSGREMDIEFCKEKTGKSEEECMNMMQGKMEYRREYKGEYEEEYYKLPDECAGMTKEECMAKMSQMPTYEGEQAYQNGEHPQDTINILEEGIKTLDESSPEDAANAVQSVEEESNAISGSAVYNVLGIMRRLKE